MSGFQTVEEFEREHAGFVTEQEQAEARRRQPIVQLNKKKRQAVNAEDLRVERRALEEIGLTNWIGRLLEYRNAHPVTDDGLKYLDQTVDTLVTTRFTSTVVISETAVIFGTGVSFSNKKAAKQHASKKAIDWLIENKFMPSDGTVKFPKTIQPLSERGNSVVTTASPMYPRSSAIPATTYSSQVPGLCTMLGLNVPRYELVPIAPGAPVYDCWADFSDPHVDGRVGEVRAIHGKKRAKEMTAKEVVSFLRDIERQRKAGLEDDYEERKRKRSVDEPASPQDLPGKVIKV